MEKSADQFILYEIDRHICLLNQVFSSFKMEKKSYSNLEKLADFILKKVIVLYVMQVCLRKSFNRN